LVFGNSYSNCSNLSESRQIRETLECSEADVDETECGEVSKLICQTVDLRRSAIVQVQILYLQHAMTTKLNKLN